MDIIGRDVNPERKNTHTNYKHILFSLPLSGTNGIYGYIFKALAKGNNYSNFCYNFERKFFLGDTVSVMITDESKKTKRDFLDAFLNLSTLLFLC